MKELHSTCLSEFSFKAASVQLRNETGERLFSHRNVKSHELGYGERKNFAFLPRAKIICSLG